MEPQFICLTCYKDYDAKHNTNNINHRLRGDLDLVFIMIKFLSVNGYEFKCDFTYQPHERASRHYPGATECVEIDDVWDSDGDKIKEYAFDLLQDELEEACLNAVHIDQEEDKMTKEENRQEAWEERQRLQWE